MGLLPVVLNGRLGLDAVDQLFRAVLWSMDLQHQPKAPASTLGMKSTFHNIAALQSIRTGPIATIRTASEGQLMHSPAATLAAALQGLGCRVTRREADWSFDFGERHTIAASVPWRVVTADGIAHGMEDDGQWFGLAQPVDGEARTNELLQGQKIVGVEVDGQTADLRLVFDGGARLDFFNNSSGYEGWQAMVPAAGKELTVIALGGGGLTTL